MKINEAYRQKLSSRQHGGDPCDGERGSATVIAVLVLGLLTVFVAIALSRTATESMIMGNDAANTRAFYAAQASLETMSRNFNKIFEARLNPTDLDLANIRDIGPLGFPGYTFNQQVTPAATALIVSQVVTVADGDLQGLNSLQDPWVMTTTATGPSGAEVQLTRTFFNNRVPIFQFGVFYNDDMEFHPGPRFDFGGRVHSNGNLFLAAISGLFFRSRVTAAGEIVHDVARNGRPFSDWGDNVWVADPAGVSRRVTQGSSTGGPDTTAPDEPDMPDGSQNANWPAFSNTFGGNLLARQRALRLPLQSGNADPIELIKRGLPADSQILSGSRYYNKPGIRITLSDTQALLPDGDGDGIGDGGVRLDGNLAIPGARGYTPPPMVLPNYQATTFNGNRLYLGTAAAPRETWIKVEIVRTNPPTLAPVTTDITSDFLSLGLTDERVPPPPPLPALGIVFQNPIEDRAVIKMQRYTIAGPPIKVTNVNNADNTPQYTPNALGQNFYTYDAAAGFSYVRTTGDPATTNSLLPSPTTGDDEQDLSLAEGHLAHARPTTVAGTSVVPFPIEMYDPREGLYNDSLSNVVWGGLYPNSTIPRNGVMSMIDIDVANFRQFITGVWNDQFPNNAALPAWMNGSLSSDDVPNNDGAGWIIYVSDRRGDADNDGEYDMENIYIANMLDDTLQAGEDVNGDGVLQIAYGTEAERYSSRIETDVAAVFDHQYFRRGVRLINGRELPGNLNSGFTLAAENGVYVLGNYNATGISAVGTPSQPNQYTGLQVPASIAGDAVTTLSNAWNDGKSFRHPFDFGTLGARIASETTVRAALLTGDPQSSLRIGAADGGAPNQGGGDQRMNGGVHNFKRFLENWGGIRLNYCGSLINLFNSRQNNGAFKCCNHIYGAPGRNWVFDTSFLDPTRLPPGTPFLQAVEMTGFRQTNN